DYLRKFDYLKQGRAYRSYLDMVADLLGPIEPGAVFLDAGCGNGTLGVWAQRMFTRPAESSLSQAAMWLSVDLTPAGLHQAMRQHVAVRGEDVHVASGGRASPAAAPFDLAYLQTDFDRTQFPDGPDDPLGWLAAGSIDGVAASLLLSY